MKPHFFVSRDSVGTRMFKSEKALEKYKGCTRKISLPLIEANRIAKKENLRVYLCQHCKNWHVTHIKNKIK
jgi:hypothetical protein